MSATIIDVENVSKSYTEYVNGQKISKEILKDISFSLKKGEMLGIIGLNGSGKSTLLKIISGIIKPSKGKVTHFGKYSAILDLGFGMIPDLTGRENIYMIGKSEGLSNEFIKSVENEIISFSELGNSINSPVKLYSNGMFLRLAFSIKIIFAYDLLIIDEIINVGDIIFQDKCFKKIKELTQQGKSLILVSHSLEDIIKFTDTAIIINNGKLLLSGNTINIVSKYKEIISNIKFKDNPKNYTGEKNQNIDILNFYISKSKIKMSEEINMHFVLKIKQPDAYDVIIYISDHRGIILSDSPSYRENNSCISYNKGEISFSCILPKNLFNKGIFYVGLMVGNRKCHFVENMELLKFEVEPDEWDKNNIWTKEHDYFPLRPKLDWKYND